ncbi:MAG TPA: preprotein translocase subunit YajC [Firmicutes bacterium]|jgi:preprotein translocase subunit YajC|nr:preprotein translocase subunit YajC [Bacillota bacterium]HPT67641.1 preprotein translocase subunit YajC [Bacillota bacterium]
MPQNAQALQGIGAFLPMILVLAFMWFALITPQRKQQKERQKMLSELKKGDKVITIGGIHGEIIDLDEDDVKLRVADKVEIKMLRSAISRVKGE